MAVPLPHLIALALLLASAILLAHLPAARQAGEAGSTPPAGAAHR